MKLTPSFLILFSSIALFLAAPVSTLINQVFAANRFRQLAGKRVGLLTNPSGINHRLESTIDVLQKATNVRLVALFGPEHGIYGDILAGDHVETQTDPRTGLPV